MRKLSLFLLPATLVACGGGDDGPAVIDAAGGGIDAPAACTISSANFNDAGALQGAAFFEANPQNAAEYTITVQGALEAAEPTDLLVLQFYTGYEPFGTEAAPTPVVPATYNLTGAQTSFATCGVCARIATNATTTGSDDDYFATGGSVTVGAVGDAVGETLTVSLSNVTFTHVTINADTNVTTPVGDGCDTAITNATFSGMVMASTKPSMGPSPAARAAANKFRR